MKKLNYSILLFTITLMISCTGIEVETPLEHAETNVEANEKEQEEADVTEDFLVEKDLGDGMKSMKGLLASVGETGQAPMEYNVNISNGLKEGEEGLKYESFELWMEGDEFPEVRKWEADYQFEAGTFDQFNNKIIEVTYTEEVRLRAADVLTSKPTEVKEGLLLVEGTLKEIWEHGDEPGSLVLMTAEGEERSFEGDYEVEMEAEHQAMKGQKVFLLYKDIRQKLYERAEIIGDYKAN